MYGSYRKEQRSSLPIFANYRQLMKTYRASPPAKIRTKSPRARSTSTAAWSSPTGARDGRYSTPVKLKGPEEPATSSSKPKAQKKTEKAFDPRADDSSSGDDNDSSASDSDDDDGKAPKPDFFARINGTMTDDKSTSASTSTPTRNGLTPSKRTPRSKNEEVADSDVERDAAAKKKDDKKKTGTNGTTAASDVKGKGKESSSGESSDSSSDSGGSDGDSESESNGSKAKKNKKPAKSSAKQTKKASSSSSDDDSSQNKDSESDSDSDSDAVNKRAAKSLMNGKKGASKKAASSSSSGSGSSSSSSGSDSGSEKEAQASKKAGPSKAAPAKTASDSGDSDSDSDSDRRGGSGSDESSSSSSDSGDKEAGQSVAVAPSRTSEKGALPGFVGNDFVLRRVQGDEDGKDVADFFDQARLEGKQLWYFTAPSSIPINVIEKLDIPMNKAQSGEPVFQHDGADYGMSLSRDAAANASYQVIIPNKKGTEYQALPRNIDQVVRVKRVIQVPGSGEAAVPQKMSLPSSKGPRPQPKGLQARFRPIGVAPTESMGNIGSGSDEEDEDVEMTAAPPVSAPSKKDKKKSDKKEKKRRDSTTSTSSSQSTSAAAVTTPTSSKATKRKHAGGDDDEELASTQLMQEELSAEEKKKKKKAKKQKQKHEDVDNNSTPVAAPASAKTSTSTIIAPPSVPHSSQKRRRSELSPDDASPASPSKRDKRVSFSSGPSGSQPVVATSSQASRETPVPPPQVGRAQSAVPVPNVPHTKSVSPARDETPKPAKKEKGTKSKKSKDKQKDKDVVPSSQASLASGTTATGTPKQTPILPPTVGKAKSKK